MAKKDERCRNWTAVGYPESLPQNYREILAEELNLQWMESPVHDKDTNPDGSIKKSHIHFAFPFEGNKSYEQVKEICDRLNLTIPQKVNSMQGLIRYFIHKDNPEKWQYKRSDIFIYGNFDINDYFRPTNTETIIETKEIQAFIRDNGITEYATLCDYIEQMDNDWFYIVTTIKTQHFKEYIRSKRYGGKKNEE